VEAGSVVSGTAVVVATSCTVAPTLLWGREVVLAVAVAVRRAAFHAATYGCERECWIGLNTPPPLPPPLSGLIAFKALWLVLAIADAVLALAAAAVSAGVVLMGGAAAVVVAVEL
jgi:hypothetical protein